MQKRGQGISLNVIIIAAIGLIVLVLLIAIFTGKLALFEKTIGEETKIELAKLRITYGNCQPSASTEQEFSSNFNSATTQTDKAAAKTTFQGQISACRAHKEEATCSGDTSCFWSG